MEIWDHIVEAGKPSGDILGIQYGIVADNQDPLKLQRVQVYDQAKGGKHKSDWLIRGLPFTSFSPPVPKIGDLVSFGYIMGNPHHGCYIGCAVNNVNRPVGADDSITVVLGGVKVSIDPVGNVRVSGAKLIEIKDTQEVNIATTKLVVKTTGDLSLEGKDIKIKGETITYDVPDINFGAPSSAKISGKQVVTLTGVDTRGDTMVDRGW